MERKIHDARASRLRDVNDKHDVGGRSVAFTEETVLRAKRGSAAGVCRAFSSARDARGKRARSRSWNREPRAREIATAAPHRTARDRVRSRRE